uniref:PBECR2 domain-containing protein n=1 Tax=Heterorhabditis bacteriophora TaxID=37862 RepID=A0A1I7WVW5_HETBA
MSFPPKVIEIYDPKKRNEIVQSFLKNRKEHKFKNLEERSNLESVEDHRIEVFKPILESNKKLQEEIIDEKNKIVQTLNSFRDSPRIHPNSQGVQQISQSTPQILPPQTPKQIQSSSPKNRGSQSPSIKVSNLIATYLQDPRDKSNAGYSIRYNNDTKGYTIGTKEVFFDNNTITINDEDYQATNGLMELLTKKSPNLTKITDQDKQDYKYILICSDALYQGFNKDSKRYNADASDKWKFIKEHYFTTKSQNQSTSLRSGPLGTSLHSGPSGTSQGSSIIPEFLRNPKDSEKYNFLPSDLNGLLDSLRLSIGSYQADNAPQDLKELKDIHLVKELKEEVKEKKKVVDITRKRSPEEQIAYIQKSIQKAS